MKTKEFVIDAVTGEVFANEIDYAPVNVVAIEREALRRQRRSECFPIINRGQLWYGVLSDQQSAELASWYADWLDVTETMVVPTAPSWLSEV